LLLNNKKTEVNKMNKTELISAVAEKTGLSKKDADSAVNVMLSTIVDTVAKDEKVQIVGFGTFELRSRSERQGRDPRTNSPITIPASRVPAFKAGKAFKDSTSI
jgi:DNA-binding protein HU-beta